MLTCSLKCSKHVVNIIKNLVRKWRNKGFEASVEQERTSVEDLKQLGQNEVLIFSKDTIICGGTVAILCISS